MHFMGLGLGLGLGLRAALVKKKGKIIKSAGAPQTRGSILPAPSP